MRYALIIAGGSGTRLWPMSRAGLPKQLIPFIQGKSLLEIAFERLEGLIPISRRYVCAGFKHSEAILKALPILQKNNFLGEPVGRDTLNAIGLGAAVLAQKDPDAVFAVVTADHLIEPIDKFQKILEQGFDLVEKEPQTLVTFGITPTSPETAYGYLELGDSIAGEAKIVKQFKEKPALALAEKYLQAGPESYLWNSGMFVWRAGTLLDCIKTLEPAVYADLMKIAQAWDTPQKEQILSEIYPTLKKISIDFAVMEPASRMDKVRVAAIPMKLKWMDVGSWPAFAKMCRHDQNGNAVGGPCNILLDTSNCLPFSNDPKHMIAMLGCRDLIVIHTDNVTLICSADKAEQIKELHKQAEERFGGLFI